MGNLGDEPTIETLLEDLDLKNKICVILNDPYKRLYVALMKWLAGEGHIRRPSGGFDFLDNYQHGGGSPGGQLLKVLSTREPNLTVAEFKTVVEKNKLNNIVNYLGEQEENEKKKLTDLTHDAINVLAHKIDRENYNVLAKAYGLDHFERRPLAQARVQPAEFSPGEQTFEEIYMRCPNLKVAVLIQWADETDRNAIGDLLRQLTHGQPPRNSFAATTTTTTTTSTTATTTITTEFLQDTNEIDSARTTSGEENTDGINITDQMRYLEITDDNKNGDNPKTNSSSENDETSRDLNGEEPSRNISVPNPSSPNEQKPGDARWQLPCSLS